MGRPGLARAPNNPPPPVPGPCVAFPSSAVVSPLQTSPSWDRLCVTYALPARASEGRQGATALVSRGTSVPALPRTTTLFPQCPGARTADRLSPQPPPPPRASAYLRGVTILPGLPPPPHNPHPLSPSLRAVLKNPIFLVKDSPQGPPATNRHQPPTVINHQPAAANSRYPPTIVQHCFCGLVSFPCLDHDAEGVPVNVRFCCRYNPPPPPKGQPAALPLGYLPQNPAFAPQYTGTKRPSRNLKPEAGPPAPSHQLRTTAICTDHSTMRQQQQWNTQTHGRTHHRTTTATESRRSA